MHKRWIKTLLSILLIILLPPLYGCGSVTIHQSGTRIDRDLVDTIETGVTTRQMVIETFDEPTDVRTLEGGKELFTYIYEEEKAPTYLGGIIENRTRKTTVITTLEITFTNGVVSSYKFKRNRDNN
ncbi:MAG: hypothetical protein ACE5GF_08090 [Thermodesulfobacteriota bacterium]